MINKLSGIIFFFLIHTTLLAQNVLKERDSCWAKSIQTGININQASFSDNWKGGGTNSLALGTFLNGRLNYRAGKVTFENELQSQYGMLKSQGQEFRKNSDRIFIDSKLGYNITKQGRLSIFLSVNFVSQFGNGFMYRKDSNQVERGYLISNFLSPGYLTSSLGLQYRPVEYFWMRLGTGTLRQTFVLDTTVHREQPKNYGVPIGKKVRHEIALQFVANFDKEITKNFFLKARFMAFGNYDSLDVIDTRLDVSFTAKINKFINVNLTGVMLYDQDMDYKIQYSQALTLGILYNYTEFKE